MAAKLLRLLLRALAPGASSALPAVRGTLGEPPPQYREAAALPLPPLLRLLDAASAGRCRTTPPGQYRTMHCNRARQCAAPTEAAAAAAVAKLPLQSGLSPLLLWLLRLLDAAPEGCPDSQGTFCAAPEFYIEFQCHTEAVVAAAAVSLSPPLPLLLGDIVTGHFFSGMGDQNIVPFFM